MNIVKRAIQTIRKYTGGLSPVPAGNRGWWPLIQEPYSGAWQQNQEWTVDTVLTHPTVYACITLISNDIAKLRARLVQQDSDGIWTETTSAAFSPVLRKPNRYQNHIQHKQWWAMSKLLRGNTYALKQRDNRGVVVGEYILDACRVTPLVAPDGSVYYQLSQDNLSGVPQTGITVPASEIIHDRMNCLFHPLVGVSPLFAAGLAANIGLKIEGNTAYFFGNGNNPGGVLIAPGAISQQNADEIKTYWQANYTGSNAGKLAVLGDGLKYEPLRMSAVDAQLIEVLKWTDEKICSAFHVPAYKVGVGALPAYNNIEALQQEYYNTCLQILIEEYELAQDEGLGLSLPIDGRQMGVELDLDGLLRMDTKTLIETMGAGVDKAIITPNEARRRLNYGKLDGGDTVYMQQQDFPLDEVRKNKIQAAAPPVPPEDSEDSNDEEMAAEDEVRALLDHIRKGIMSEA